MKYECKYCEYKTGIRSKIREHIIKEHKHIYRAAYSLNLKTGHRERLPFNEFYWSMKDE